MPARPIPERHWRSYGERPLPSSQEALSEPFAAFPSWFLKVTCDRCGKVTWLNEAHTSDRRRQMALSLFLARMRHEGCGGLPARAELLTGLEAASSGPVRRIVLLG
jgi:hypothetical protein